MRRSLPARLISFFFTVLFFSVSTLGCIYGPPFATVCEKYSNASSVVIAVVEEVGSLPNEFHQKVRISIKRSYKGDLTGSLDLHQPLSTCDWDFSDQVGKALLLYLKKSEKAETRYYAIGTGYGGEIGRESDDLYWLSGLPSSQNRNRISGAVVLYDDERFETPTFISGVTVTISDKRNKFITKTDEKGVYEFWNVPSGRYRILPSFDDGVYELRFPLQRGNIRWKKTPNGLLRDDDFEVTIGPEKCGGADYILRKRND